MIGDVLVSSILCEHIKSHDENFKVHYMVNEHTLAVVERNPFIDKLVVFKPEYKSDKARFLTFLRGIRNEGYDTVIDVYGKLESGLTTLFSGASAKIAYEKWYSKALYTHRFPLSPKIEGETGNTVEDRLGLLKPLGIGPVDRSIRPKIYLGENEIESARQFLDGHGVNRQSPLIMLNILGSSPAKTYPLRYMAKLINDITARYKAQLLFNYIPSQAPLAEELYGYCSERSRESIIFDAFAPSLRAFLGLLSHCDALIGNEGGAVNMAKALSIPTFSIYSPRISKMAWHTFSGERNLAVHLGDYFPKQIENKSRKDLGKAVPELYEKFEPGLFFELLTEFLDSQVLSDQ